MYHKRRVVTENAFCGKIPGSELYNITSIRQSTTCNEAIASTERKKNCEGVKLKNLAKKIDTYYTMYHKRRVKTTRNALCGKIPGSELYYTPSLGKRTTCTEAIKALLHGATNCINTQLKSTKRAIDCSSLQFLVSQHVLKFIAQRSNLSLSVARGTIAFEPRECVTHLLRQRICISMQLLIII